MKFFFPALSRTVPAPSQPVAVQPHIEPDLITELARINDSICGVGANWPYLAVFQRKLRIEAMRVTLRALAVAELEHFPGCDQESVGHMRAVLASLLAKGGGHVH